MCLKFGQANTLGQSTVGTHHAPLSPDVTVCPLSLMSPVPLSPLLLGSLLFINLARHISVLHELFAQDAERESSQKAELVRSSGTQVTSWWHETSR